ncbi:MAG TPA: RICIN domain-containing protein, partial [Actinokineospora sp.]|nr:RICIN domain-containing protein [Actinokineospora sp.]
VGSTLQTGGRCLEVVGGGQVDGTFTAVNTCVTGAANQSWSVQADGSIRNGTKCLDASSGGTANGTRLIIWSCHGGANQKWTIG